MSSAETTIPLDQVEIRTYRRADSDAVRRLYEQGRLAGQEMPNDTAADIDNISEAYLAPDRAHFWVADYAGRVVGMIGVAEDERDLAEIRRLRVDPDYQGQGVANKLMETALSFCRHHDYLKVVLDTRLERGPAMDIFDRFAFQHNRTRDVGGKEVLEFYLDLYREPRQEDSNNN